MTQNEKRQHIIEAMDNAIGLALMEQYPEAVTGDVDPMADMAFSEAVGRLVDSWVMNNITTAPAEA